MAVLLSFLYFSVVLLSITSGKILYLFFCWIYDIDAMNYSRNRCKKAIKNKKFVKPEIK